MNLATKEYVDNNGGETKAKAWLCTRNGQFNVMNDFGNLQQYVGSILESLNYIDSSSSRDSDVFAHQIAKIVFKEEKSMAEVSQWLNFEAEINGGSPMCSYLPVMAENGYCAVCPWPDNVPWLYTN